MALEKRIMTFLSGKYDSVQAPGPYCGLYEDVAEPLSTAFAYLHSELNILAEFMAEKGANGHYNAEPSRALLRVIGEIEELRTNLSRIGRTAELTAPYEEFIAVSKAFLEPSGGSPIPDDFKPLQIEKFSPVFYDRRSAVSLANRQHNAELKLIGEGAYAQVFSFKDPQYGTKFALKRAKPNLAPIEVQRFQQEFEIMSKLDSPYVLSVYKFEDDSNSYTMEYCHTTVAKLIERRNTKLSLAWRKRLALQLLHGVQYLHMKDILHRDLSANNLLVKEFEYGVVSLKLADFGLAKSSDSTLTRTHSSIKGTIVDPALESFRDYSVQNEIYVLGFLLNLIFTGRQRIIEDDAQLSPILQRATSPKPSERYKTVAELTRDVEALVTDTSSNK